MFKKCTGILPQRINIGITISSVVTGKNYRYGCCKRKLFPIIPIRQNHHTSNTATAAEPVEIEISVPWGTVAGRLWNSSDATRKPVLCMHGWKDNAATFNDILPLLVHKLPNYQFLAIDYPGHGFSSHFPPGMLYQMSDIIVLVGRIVKALNWPSMTIIGHSLGAIIGFLFTGTHNNGLVEKFVALDALTPFVFDNHDLLDMIPKIVRDLILLDEKHTRKNMPLFTYEEIMEKFVQSHLGGLDSRTCQALISRGVRETEPGSKKYYFTHDIRLRYLTVMALSPRQISCVAKNFRTPVLYIKAEDGVRYIPKIIGENIQGWLQDQRCQRGRVIFVKHPGPHHLHITNANQVSDVIANFLNSA